jgi:general secretion pathway protein I
LKALKIREKGSDVRGFSLLETMIALAIIGIALVTLLGLGNRSITISDRLQKITQATLLAQEKMTETELTSQAGNLDPQNEEGGFDVPFEIYRWRTDFEETPLAAVRMVTVTVLWGDENKNELVELTSFVFRRDAAP